MVNRYSVYERGTDRPIIIAGTAKECVAALGIETASFYKQTYRTRRGLPPQKYEIFTDDPEEVE